jgi:N-acetylglucosamine-6-phosphate deacetylase
LANQQFLIEDINASTGNTDATSTTIFQSIKAGVSISQNVYFKTAQPFFSKELLSDQLQLQVGRGF